ncbi:integrase core domain-containing protein [Actinomadura napierensis]|uniref:integrase core domain-containing protein n=1 Tax=Actinomadura napierensis TaxID=267854 RepID=UPI00387E5540
MDHRQEVDAPGPESADGTGRERSAFSFPRPRRDAKFSEALDAGHCGQHHRTADTTADPTSKCSGERRAGSVRRECTDRLLVFSRNHLEAVSRVYADHLNGHRPHRSLGQRPPAPPPEPVPLDY